MAQVEAAQIQAAAQAIWAGAEFLVTSYAPAIPVRDGRTGQVVGGRDPAAVTDAVAGLLADPDRARELGAAGREWMRQEWTWPVLVERLHRLLAGARAGA